MSGKYSAKRHSKKPKKPKKTKPPKKQKPVNPDYNTNPISDQDEDSMTVSQGLPKAPLTPQNKRLIISVAIASAAVLIAIGIAIAVIIANHQPEAPSNPTTATKATVNEVPSTTVKKDNKTATASSDPDNTTEATAENSGAEDSSEDVTNHKKSDAKLPDELSNALTASGYSEDSLYGSQIIVVDSHGDDSGSASISFFENTGSDWKATEGLTTVNGYVGASGVGQASEYVTVTPAGMYNIITAFGFDSSIDTGLDYFQITENSYWVDDPDSEYYNMHIEGTDKMDWDSAEHMIDYPSNYNYGFAFDYNMDPIEKGKGSAFFMHVGSQPTHGCVAVSQDVMIKTLKWLDKNCSPCILIV